MLNVKKKLVIDLQNRIAEIEIAEFHIDGSEADNLVEYIENPLKDSGLNKTAQDEVNNQILTEVTSLGLDQSDKVTTKWITENPEDTPFLMSTKLEDTPGITSLMKTVKAMSSDFSGINACLVTFYPDGSSKTRLHADRAAYISQDVPICNYSIGSERTISFFNAKVHSSPALKSVTMASRSLLVMKPSCQDRLKHIVVPDPLVTEPRFCLSFRKVVPLHPDPIICKDADNTKSATVLIGTSITKRINPAKIVGKHGNP